MIYGIWIIDMGGNCLFYKDFGTTKLDSDLFASFFSAIYNFGREMGGRPLKNITMGDISYTTMVKDDLFFVIATDPGENAADLIEEIARVFNKHFGSNYALFTDLRMNSLEEIKAFEKEIESLVRRPKSIIARRFRGAIYPKRKVRSVDLLSPSSSIRMKALQIGGVDAINVLMVANGKYTVDEIAQDLSLDKFKVEKIIREAVLAGLAEVEMSAPIPDKVEKVLQDLLSGRLRREQAIDEIMAAMEIKDWKERERIKKLVDETRAEAEKQKRIAQSQRKLHKRVSRDDFTAAIKAEIQKAAMVIESLEKVAESEEAAESSSSLFAPVDKSEDTDEWSHLKVKSGHASFFADESEDESKEEKKPLKIEEIPTLKEILQKKPRCFECRKPITGPHYYCKKCDISVHYSCVRHVKQLSISFFKQRQALCPICGSPMEERD